MRQLRFRGREIQVTPNMHSKLLWEIGNSQHLSGCFGSYSLKTLLRFVISRSKKGERKMVKEKSRKKGPSLHCRSSRHLKMLLTLKLIFLFFSFSQISNSLQLFFSGTCKNDKISYNNLSPYHTDFIICENDTNEAQPTHQEVKCHKCHRY